MASIPLPALSIRPQQPASPLEQYSHIAQLQGLAQQQQLGAEQLKGAQLNNQTSQMDFDDQQKWRKAFMDAQGDPDKTLELASKSGVSPKSVLGYRTSLLEQRTKLATLTKDQLANAKAQAELIGGHAQAALSAPPEQRPQAVQASLADLVKQGVMDPQSAQQSFMEYQQQGDDWLKLHATAAMSSKDQIDTALAAQKRAEEAQAAAAKLPGEIAGSQIKQKELAGTNAQGMTAAQQGQQRMEQLRLGETKRHNTMMEGMGLPDGGAPSTAAATIDQVPPMLKGQVQSILEYRQQLPPAGRNNPRNNALQYWVNKLDPTYDSSTFPARSKILQSYTSGPESKSINAINTALGHLGELDQAAQALSQNNVPLLHSLASKVGAATGDTAATTYQSILHRVSPEMTAAYVQGGGGEGERGANQSDFDISKGAQQISANIAESAKLLRSKISAQENQWNTTFKPTKEGDQFQNRFITPAAKQTLERLSTKTGGLQVGQAVTVKGKQMKVTAVHPDGSFDAQ